MTIKGIFKKIGKILLYIICIVIIIVIGVIIFIHTNYGKRIITDKVQSYLQKKLETKVVIGAIDFRLPKWIEIKGIYIEDQHKDTLLYGEKLAVDLNMFKLIRGETYIRKVEFKNIYANISRPENDSIFNFQFVIDAFTGNKPTSVTTDTTALRLTLRKLILDDIRVNFNDQYSGTNFSTRIDTLNVELSKFQPDRLQFGINKFFSSGVDFTMLTYKSGSTANSSADTGISKNSLILAAETLNLHYINVSVKDSITGMYYGNNVKYLSLADANIDLAKQKVNLNKIILDSSTIKFISPKELPIKDKEDTATSSTAWNIQTKQIQMKGNAFQFDDNNIKPRKGLDFAHLDVKNIDIDTREVKYQTDSISAGIDQLAFTDKSGFIIDTTHANITYHSEGISAKDMYIKTPQSIIQNTIEVKYDDIKKIISEPQNTLVNVKLDSTVVAINDLYIIMPVVEKFMPKQKFYNNTIALNTEIKGSLRQLNIPFLQLKGFSGTRVYAKAILYNAIDPNQLGYNITVFNSILLKSDIQKFMPRGNSLSATFPSVIQLNAAIKGNVRNSTAAININSNNNAFRLNGAVNIRNINNSDVLQYNIAIKDSRIEKSFITSLIPKKSLPPSLQLPNLIILRGTAKGDMNNVQTDLKLDGSYGSAAINGYVNNFKNKETAYYNLLLTTNNFKLGSLIKQDTIIGSVTLSATAKGRGFNYKTMQSEFNVDIQKADFKNYGYQNISLNADLKNGYIAGNGNINDPNAQLNFVAKANVSEEYPSVEATINIDTVQLNALHLYKDTLNVSLVAYIKAASLDPKNLDVYAVIDSSKINLKNKFCQLDSITLKANSSAGVNTINFNSPLADLFVEGKFEYNKIGTSIIQYINKYYTITDTVLTTVPPQQIAFEGVIKRNLITCTAVEGLDYENITFKGAFNSQAGDSALSIMAGIPYLIYQQNKIRSGSLSLNSTNEKINGIIKFDTLVVANNTFFATQIDAKAISDSFVVDAITQDNKNTDRYAIGATILKKNETYEFSLHDNLLLNYQKWDVAEDNRITYSPNGILVNNFLLSNSNGSAKISAASKQNILNAPIEVSITNFDIKDIAALANKDTLLASGLINGQFLISEFNKKLPAFTGNMEVTQLHIQQQPVGTVKLFAQKQEENTINAKLELTENNNKVTIQGNYFLNNDEKQFEANIAAKGLSMQTLQAFSQGNLSRSSGNINGNILLQGKFSDPRWNGALNFDTTRFTIAKTGTTYNIDKQRILLNYPTISFNNFTIRDTANNTLKLNGQLTSKSLMEYDLALNINAKDFILVNAPKAIANQLYGFAAINADVDVSGNSTSPDIEGNISLNDKTNVTLVLPEQNINKNASASVVRFIDRDTFNFTEKKAFELATEPKPNFAQFLNYNLNIEINRDAVITVIIDPSSGDELKIQGDAKLNAGVDPGGNLILAGNYELSQGHYILNYQFLRRQFNLLSGSTIAFSGPPTNAQINVTAEYVVNTSARDLLGNELGSVDARTANTFNQKIPFRVLLYLKGSMMKPNISFDIQLPDETTQISSEVRTTIENKLAQIRDDVAATNKQVFSLLILNRFIGEQSTDFFKGNDGASSGLGNVAINSVSGFLVSALDEIAADLFKGINIDLNLNSYADYSTGIQQQRRDLNVAVSKSFLNDRISITVGKNFGIEGQDANARASQQNGLGFLPDVTVNYKLTQDGKYLLRAYKKSQFEVVLDGYVIETGLSFIVTIDYDKFKELFNRKRKTEE